MYRPALISAPSSVKCSLPSLFTKYIGSVRKNFISSFLADLSWVCLVAVLGMIDQGEIIPPCKTQLHVFISVMYLCSAMESIMRYVSWLGYPLIRYFKEASKVHQFFTFLTFIILWRLIPQALRASLSKRPSLRYDYPFTRSSALALISKCLPVLWGIISVAMFTEGILILIIILLSELILLTLYKIGWFF